MNRKFQKREENFVCENCGAEIIGDGYTNHCFDCLCSKHVDNFPGDRENDCQGLMDPVEIEKEKDNLFVVQICRKCGEKKRNKISKNDDREKVLKIMRKKSEQIMRQ